MVSSPDPKAGGQRPPEQDKQGDTVPPLSKTRKSRFPWKSFFHRSATAVFVLGPNGRLRYANPAWDSLTGKSFAALRGTRISAKRESASPLWKVLAPPPETWAGQPIHVRRPRPEVEYGPPWWDVQFVPLKQSNGNAVIGFVSQVGETPEKNAFREPEALAAARAEHAKWYTLELFAGISPEMQRFRQQLQMASQSTAPVWIHGPAGSGKETAARVIHQLGPNKDKSFVVLDCKALQPYMIEQLVFGRGGFAASKGVGTLGLKHPQVLPHDLQQRIAGWSTARNSPRFIVVSDLAPETSKTNPCLVDDVLAKLAAIEIRTVGLATRAEELRQIVSNFGFTECDPGVWPALQAFTAAKEGLKGMRHAVAEAARNAGSSMIREEHLPEYVRQRKLIADSPPPTLTPLADVLERAERKSITMALSLSGGKPSVAAERLGMTRAKLLKRMKALGIEP